MYRVRGSVVGPLHCVSFLWKSSLADIQYRRGTFISIQHEYGCCSFHRTWSSQPLLGSIPAGNFELSNAILFSGSMLSKFIRSQYDRVEMGKQTLQATYDLAATQP